MTSHKKNFSLNNIWAFRLDHSLTWTDTLFRVYCHFGAPNSNNFIRCFNDDDSVLRRGNFLWQCCNLLLFYLVGGSSSVVEPGQGEQVQCHGTGPSNGGFWQLLLRFLCAPWKTVVIIFVDNLKLGQKMGQRLTLKSVVAQFWYDLNLTVALYSTLEKNDIKLQFYHC